MTDILNARNLRVFYGKVEALFGVNLSVGEGQIVTVIGPNGAGKSSLLNALAGLLRVEGRVLIGGIEADFSEPEERLELGVCLVPEKRELFGSLSVEDNLVLGYYSSRKFGRSEMKQRLDGVYDRFPRLRDRKTQLAATLSGGERQMLALGRALMSRPRLLMLDEPSLGLAPRIVKEIFQIITSLRDLGMSILLVEQNARAALQVSDYAYVLENGNVVLEGTSASLRDDPRIVQTYLGLGRKSYGEEAAQIG